MTTDEQGCYRQVVSPSVGTQGAACSGESCAQSQPDGRQTFTVTAHTLTFRDASSRPTGILSAGELREVDLSMQSL